MSTRRVMTWMIFWASVALALGALAWVTIEVVALEQREAEARAQASRQETIRRALWRMDSRIAPILAIEASRPTTDYESISDDDAGWIRRASKFPGTASALGMNLSYARSYFNIAREPARSDSDEDRILSMINTAGEPPAASPESAVKPGRLSDPDARTASRASDEDPRARVDQAQGDSDYEARKRVADLASQSVQGGPNQLTLDSTGAGRDIAPARTSGSAYSQALSGGEPEMNRPAPGASSDPSGLEASTLRPRWIADERGDMQLVLVRSVLVGGRPVVQGVWMNWDRLRGDLLDSVSDVLPGSALVPVPGSAPPLASVYQLATIPVAFVPPARPALSPWRWTPATVGLLVTWIAIVMTIVAVGAVLRAAIVLSERRGRFVSAVTHELRTPLTTFRLYSQMLADGMVTDEQVRSDYLTILKRESERLTGIVENVLEYARLTRARSARDKAAGVQTLSPGALVARFRPALSRRAQQSNLDLVVSLDLEEHTDRTLTADPHAVERIMMNLVENACKYAAPSEADDASIEDIDTRIHLDVRARGDTLELLVADHGPGIAPGEGAQIFGEFQRGWRGLSNARSGLGLGLALSRGLAREMQGDLVLTKRRGHGAEFLLTIPLDAEAIGNRQ